MSRKALKIISQLHVDAQYLQQYGSKVFQGQEDEDSKKNLKEVIHDMIQELQEIENYI